MSSATPSADTFTRPQVLSLAAAIACVVTVGIGLSLSIPLLSFALDAKGASRTLIGFNTAMPGVATLVCAPFISGWARRFGMAPTLAGAIIVAAVSLLAFNAVTPIWAWFPIRFMLGAALTVLFVLSEYWINAAAPESRRGLVLGVYATALSLGFALGPQVLGLVGTSGWPPYAAGAAILLLSGIPIALAGGRAPPIEDKPSAGFLSFFWLVPSATLAALVFGAAETSAIALLPLYGTAIGLETASAIGLVSAFVLGNVLFQIPMGIIADRTDRRLVLLFCGASGVIGMAALTLATLPPTGIFVLLMLLGGLVAGLYTVGLAHLGSRFRGADLAQANAAFVVFYSIGLIVGPPLGGAGMDLWPPHGLPATLAVMFLIYVAVVLARMARRG
jgi:MFS family permease